MIHDEFEKLLAVPTKPFETARAANWQGVEQQLGTTLPTDYKRFIQLYGTGEINGFLTIWNPFSSYQYVNLLQQSRVEGDSYRSTKSLFPDLFVDDVFPDLGGLLAFASTDNGEVLYWRTQGQPDQWTVTVYESRGPKHFDCNGSMTQFLIWLLTKKISCDVLPWQFLEMTPDFRAFGPNMQRNN